MGGGEGLHMKGKINRHMHSGEAIEHDYTS